MRDPKETNFCYYPFMQILITSDGRYRPCSKHQDYITDGGRELRAGSGDTLEDAWSSDYMQDIRKHFLENRKFEGCRECWRMQDMGLRSMRFDSYQYGVTEQQVSHPEVPVRIEINASNVCNLKCRICYPNASTKWIKEHGELYGSKERTYQNLPIPNMEVVKSWGGHLEEVCFFGGEPLLSEDNLSLMDHFIDQGDASHISLLFNTNGTVFNDSISERLVHFKRVRMYFSVDDIGTRFEYQRSGAKWPEVRENIGKAYALSRSARGKNIDFKICCTVSILNIYYFPEFFAWFGRHYPDLQIFWNLLFDPWQLSVQILPDEVKGKIAERLRNELKPTFEVSEEDTKTVDELLSYMSHKVEKPMKGFFEYINRHDVYRQESFPAVFGELWQTLERYKPEGYEMGQHQESDRPHVQMLKLPNEYPAFARINQVDINDISTNPNDLTELFSSALRELSRYYKDGTKTTEQKLTKLEKVLNENEEAKVMIDHAARMGLVKFYGAIMDLELEEFELVVRRKYLPLTANQE